MAKVRVVVLGGGFAGAYAAQRLLRKGRREVEVTVIDRNNYLTFYPLLVEVVAGAVEPRHVVLPIRSFCRGGTFIMAEIQAVDLVAQTISIQVAGSDLSREVPYDHLILATGSTTRLFNIPGLVEHARLLKSVPSAIAARDRAIEVLELANQCPDAERRARYLSTVVVGAGPTGVELAAEIHAVQTEICRDYPNLSRDDVRVTIVENSDRILGALRPEAAAYCQGTLQLRGVRFRLKSGVTAVTAEGAVIGPDDQIAAETVYWTAGVAPSPLLSAIPGLPLNERGYIRTEASLQVEGLTNVWAIGDSAAVLDPEGKPYAATAQNAIRQGPLAADNLLVGLRKGKAAPFRYRPMGSFTIIGRHKAVAELNGRLFYGFLAWLLFRGAYLTKIPGFAAKLRLIFDWTLELILPPTAVQFGMGPRDSRAG